MTYDAIGNPLTYRDGMTMTWQNGRELATLVNGNKTMSYTYGADGLRTTKQLNSTLHTYEYVGGQLLYETRGAKKIHYVYDSTGNVLAAIYKPSTNSAEQTYYYAHNWRGDVVALYDSTGSLFARYDYDAWGKLLSIKDASGNDITDYNSFAIINPFRYRGYFYDTESGLYYLQSRYYDPTTGRFLNADALVYTTSDSFVGLNLFAYADNNCVNKADFSGKNPIYLYYYMYKIATAIIGIIGAAVITYLTINVLYSILTLPAFQDSINYVINTMRDKAEDLINKISKAVAKIISKTQEKRRNYNRYFEIDIRSEVPRIGKSLNIHEAVSRLRKGLNVITYFESDARRAANMAGSTGSVCDQKHGGIGYFNHYHVGNRKNKAHMFFIRRG